MRSTVVDDAPYADHREADHGPLADALLESLVARRNELARDRSPRDVVDELVSFDRVCGERFDVSKDLRVLSRAAGLLLVRVVDLRLSGDGLAVSDLRFARDDLAVVLAAHALHVDFEMEL